MWYSLAMAGNNSSGAIKRDILLQQVDSGDTETARLGSVLNSVYWKVLQNTGYQLLTAACIW